LILRIINQLKFHIQIYPPPPHTKNPGWPGLIAQIYGVGNSNLVLYFFITRKTYWFYKH